MQSNAGIDLISFYTSRYFLHLRTLAEKRGVDPEKYFTGLGQERMAVPPPDEDVVTMASSAALPILRQVDPARISLLLFATESGVDQSKAAGLFAHRLLNLPSRCRVVEVKEACYGATAALRFAANHVELEPGSLALVLASDIARYDLGSPGEPTQGCGAVAMLVSSSPRILALDRECGLHAEDVMDFWRPNYRDEALVDGKYSTRVYLSTAQRAWEHYRERSGRGIHDFKRFCYHLPFTNMARKAHAQVLKETGEAAVEEAVETAVAPSLGYNRQTGNTYSASLYEALTCLLDGADESLSGERIGLFSYGSGCMGEFFSGVVVPGYRQVLAPERHRELLDSRTELSYNSYEDIFNLKVPRDGWEYIFAQYRTGPFRFGGVKRHKRMYEALL